MAIRSDPPDSRSSRTVEAQHKPLPLQPQRLPHLSLTSPSYTSYRGTTNIWGASLGGHLAGTTGQGAADATRAHFSYFGRPKPASSFLLLQAGAQPLGSSVPTHPPPHSRRPAQRRTHSAATASPQGQMPVISPSSAPRSLRKLSESNTLPADWLRATPIPRFPGGAGLSAASLLPAPPRAHAP